MEFYKDLIINYEKCLAFSNNIDLIETNEITKKIKPFLKSNRSLTNYMNQNRYCSIVSRTHVIEKLLSNDMLNKRDYIFLSSPCIIFF